MRKGKKNSRRQSGNRTPTKKASAKRASSSSSREPSKILDRRTPIPLKFSESDTSVPKTIIKIANHKKKRSRPFKCSDDSSSSEDEKVPSNPSVLCRQCGMKLGTEQGLAEMEQNKMEPKSGFGISSSDSNTSSSSSGSDCVRRKARKTSSCPPTFTKKLCRACDEGWYSDTTHRHSDDNLHSFARIGNYPLRTDSSSLHQDFASTSRGSRAPPVPQKTFGPRRSLPGRSYRCNLPRCSSCKFRRFDDEDYDEFDEDDDDVYEYF